MTSAQLDTLRTEIAQDPAALGYAALKTKADDAALAATINLVRAGAGYVIARTDVKASEVIGAISNTDFAALTQLLISKLTFLFTGGTIDVTNSNTKQILQDIFSAASAPTKAAVLAVCTRQGSRAEVLFGANFTVAAFDCAQAR